MQRKPYQMASNKILNNAWNTIILISLFVIQFQLSIVNCSSSSSLFSSPSSKKTHEVKHFVLVHGLGHGAWCWFKVIPFLKNAGHNVTAIDLKASGNNTEQIQNVLSFDDYSVPLLDLIASLPPDEKVILVGHSLGGLSLALAMDMYPNKISLAFFVSAFLPDTAHRPSYVLKKHLGYINIPETFLDTLIYTVVRPNKKPLEVILYGPNALKYNIYQLSRHEDLVLAKMLVRPGSEFQNDLSVRKKFSEEGFGSVKKVYIKGLQDRAIPVGFQTWMIENNGEVSEVKEIINADHITMISRPRELSEFLLEEY